MANDTLPTQNALIDPEATQKVADIYAQNGPQDPGLKAPDFLTNAVSRLTSFGNGERAGMAQPYQPYEPPFDFGAIARGITTENPMFQNPYQPNAVSNFVGQIPVIGGLANYGANVIDQNALGGPQYQLNQALTGTQHPTDAQFLAGVRGPQDPDLAGQIALGVAGGGLSLEKQGARAIGEAASAAEKAALEAKLRTQAGADLPYRAMGREVVTANGSNVFTAPGMSDAQLAADQFNELAKNGASYADVRQFARTMAPPPEVAPSRAITTAEGGVADAGLLTRALQTAAGTEGVPLSQHPAFEPFSASSLPRAQRASHGGDIGTATRAVMAGDKTAIDLLGPELTQQLIQNKIADIVRRTGASETAVRIGLGTLVEREGARAAGATAEAVLAAAKAAPEATVTVTPKTDLAPVAQALKDTGATDEQILRYTGQPAPAAKVQVSDTVRDYSTLVDQMRGAGATEEEIARYIGGKPPSTPAHPAAPPVPPDRPPVPPIGGKDGLPTAPRGLPPVSRADMVSAVFRNYIVSNALSPFTLSIKAGADVLKMLDTTVEAVSQGARAGRPQQIPGSVKALYAGFLRGLTQDAATAFRYRQYAMTAEGVAGESGVIDRMLAGEFGNGAKRFAQAGDVLSLGSPIPRTISALTSVFQRAYRDMALYQNGYEAAARSGLKGAEADAFASQFMADPLSMPGGKAALEAATNESNTRTWTNANPLSKIGVRNKPIVGDLLFTVLPFVNLVTNVAREGLEFIPGVGVAAKAAEYGFRKPTAQEWTRVVQHQVMGTIGTLALAQKAAVGELTGDGPDDENQRFALMDRGWKPNHIKIGDNWYPNVSFGVLAPLLNGVGNFHDNMTYNTRAQDRDSVGQKAIVGVKSLITAELDTAHWLDSLLDLNSTLHGSASDIQNYVARYLGLFTPQSGSLKSWERVQESATPTVDSHLPVDEAIAQRYWRQFPPALRPEDLRDLPGGVPRADTGAAAVFPYAGTPGAFANYDGMGVPEGDPEHGKSHVLTTAAAIGAKDPTWRQGGVIQPPSTTIGDIRLDPASGRQYVALVAQFRDRILGAELYSSEFQNATLDQQKALFDKYLQQSDTAARSRFLADEVIDGKDPTEITSQAIEGFRAQTNQKDQAYWIALLDRAGKLTPDVVKALDETARRDPLPGQKELITVAEFRRAAPLVHEYLAHVPYGSDSHPYGTPADWLAVDAARQAMNKREDDLVRGGVNPSIAHQQAELEVIKTLPPIQQQLLHNGPLLENPQRRVIAQQYGAMLTRFLGTKPNTYQESQADYSNFPPSP